jgi:hypothetical protein
MRWLFLFASLSVSAQSPVSSAERFIRKFDQATLAANRPLIKRVAPPPAGTCSVPLTEIPVGKTERFTARGIPVQPTEPMPVVQVPAPPCPKR